MSALMIANFTIKNSVKFQHYLSEMQDVVGRYGAELLFCAKARSVLTGGNTDKEVTTIFRFPCVERINQWYFSEEHQATIALCHESVDINMIAYEVIDSQINVSKINNWR